jgi:TolB protein
LAPTATPQPPIVSPTPTLSVPTGSQTPTPTYTPTPSDALTGLIVFPIFDVEAATYNIYARSLDGSDRTLVVKEASQPTLNSNGGRIAYRSWAQNRGLFERGIDGGVAEQFDSFVEAARPVFSPDDQTFLFQSREGGDNFAIYHTTEQGYKVLRRDGVPVEGEAPVWAPDSFGIVYKGWHKNDEGLLKINLDGSGHDLLVADPSAINPAVALDGTIAYMSKSAGSWDIYVAGADASGGKQLTDDPGADGLPTWSPDGNVIAFVSDRSGEWAVWAMNADGGDQRLLFELGGSIDGVVAVDAQNSYGWLEESIDWAP